MIGYLIVTTLAVLAGLTVVLGSAGRMGSTSIRTKGPFIKVFSFEIDPGGRERPEPTEDAEA